MRDIVLSMKWTSNKYPYKNLPEFYLYFKCVLEMLLE